MNDASPVNVNRQPARPGGLALALGLLLAPAAWMVQTNLAQTIRRMGMLSA